MPGPGVKPRVMYIVHAYPQISETYVKTELEALGDEYEMMVISLQKPNVVCKNRFPVQQISDPRMILRIIAEFRPHVLHSHWAMHAGLVGAIARRTQIPFTVRTHSFDVIHAVGAEPPRQLVKAVPALNDPLCLGVIAFPFTVPMLVKAGVREEIIHPCYPVIDYRRFLDDSPNGTEVMNMGACTPKKNMESFLELGKKVPGTTFNLYALGYDVKEMTGLNDRMGRPVNMIPPRQPEDMPREYKKHRWLVYTADFGMATVGWPMAVAEAQASGVGVCMANIRPDLKEYVGDAGFLYDTIDEAADIISRPYPEEMRRSGFEQARKSDIYEHKVLLSDLWRKVT